MGARGEFAPPARNSSPAKHGGHRVVRRQDPSLPDEIGKRELARSCPFALPARHDDHLIVVGDLSLQDRTRQMDQECAQSKDRCCAPEDRDSARCSSRLARRRRGYRVARVRNVRALRARGRPRRSRCWRCAILPTVGSARKASSSIPSLSSSKMTWPRVTSARPYAVGSTPPRLRSSRRRPNVCSISAIAFDTAGCEIGKLCRGFRHASLLHHGQQDMQVPKLEPASNAIHPLHDSALSQKVMQRSSIRIGRICLPGAWSCGKRMGGGSPCLF